MSGTRSAEQTTGTVHRIFVVDDHPLVRESLSNLIDRQPNLSVCGQAGDSATAFDAVVRLQPDVVLLDLSLPGESGLELIKKLQSLPHPPRMLVLSMHDETFYAERVLRAGALGYVTKHETTDKVIEAIRRVLTDRVFVSEKVATQLAVKFVGTRLPPDSSPVERLSDRELEIFRLLGRGHGTRRIAEELNLSIKTVQAHCANIKEKLGLNDAAALMHEAVRWIAQEGLV
jgi:DNA-binding NarL/FixJ family response regulator